MSNASIGEKPGSGPRVRLRKHYDRLWSEAVDRIRSGTIELDPVLRARARDQRRGLTVIAGPSRPVREEVATFLKELRHLEPGQYYYIAPELHVTVLSLFTATVDYQPFFAQQAQYADIVGAVVKHSPPIRIDFGGVTASPGTVMIQGFFDNDALNDLRDHLRAQLRKHGLGRELDQRYRLQTAHMTVVRFREPLADSRRFAAALKAARERSFGTTAFRSFSLVQNDWYMSRRTIKIIRRYPLVQESW